MREVDDVGGAEIHLEAIDLVRQLLGAVVATIRARRRGESDKAGDGGGDQDRAADVQLENHDEKPLGGTYSSVGEWEAQGRVQAFPRVGAAVLSRSACYAAAH